LQIECKSLPNQEKDDKPLTILNLHKTAFCHIYGKKYIYFNKVRVEPLKNVKKSAVLFQALGWYTACKVSIVSVVCLYAHLRMVNLLSEAVYGEGGEGPVPDAGHVTVQRDGLRL
jgi:hypothetical protein